MSVIKKGTSNKKMDRQSYAQMFGPTVGDKVRLGDTELWIQVEKDFTQYGDEVKFGGGKVIRDGMGQSQRPSAETVDLVITNALVLDHWGIVKADVGVKEGRIYKVGKAGNPDVQDNIDIIIGPGTDVIAGEGSILTAGGIDAHIHFICPQQVEEALTDCVELKRDGKGQPWQKIPTDDFGKNEITNFAFRDIAKQYGKFLRDAHVIEMPTYLYNPDDPLFKEEDKPFAAEIFFRGINLDPFYPASEIKSEISSGHYSLRCCTLRGIKDKISA